MSVEIIENFIQKRWPYASVLFRPVRLVVKPKYKCMTYSVNYGVGTHSWQNAVFTFVEHDTGMQHIGGIECLADTPVGKEMDMLEKEVDYYVARVDIKLVLRKKREDYLLLTECFSMHQTKQGICARSAPGCVPWCTTYDDKKRRVDVRAAEKFIAARRIWLYTRDIIRELPQPIAEEIEEHFEFAW